MRKTIMFLLTFSVIFSFSWHLPGKEKGRILVPKSASGPVKSITAPDTRKMWENYRWLNKQMEKIQAKCSPALKMVTPDSPSVENDVDLQVVDGSLNWKFLAYNDGSGNGDVRLLGLCRNLGTTQAVLVVIFVSFYDKDGELIDWEGSWVLTNTNVQFPLEEGVNLCINSLEQNQIGFFQVLIADVNINDVDREKSEESASFMYGYGETGPLPTAHTQLTLDGALDFSSSPGNKLHIAGNAKNPSSTYLSFATIVGAAVFEKNNTDRVADVTYWVVGNSSSPGHDFAVYPLESKPFDLFYQIAKYEDVTSTKYMHGFLYMEQSFDISSDRAAPFGSFDTPGNGSTVSGSIPVTGWALDDLRLSSLKLYREDGGNLVYLGDVAFVEGARPDIETAFPGYPNNSKAGWGYMLLTNFLPNSGNGTFTIHAIATDAAGKKTTLGTKTIICDNANAIKPFGAIDTPLQGEIPYDSFPDYINWGWVLTPQPDMIPTDGSTLTVYIDGEPLGHPHYNLYRSDIAALFPGYANSDGAGGYFVVDINAYEEGVHTICWNAVDSGGDSDGIGSRYFSIKTDFFDDTESNDSALSTVSMETPIHNPGEIAVLPLARQDIKLKKGYGDHLPDTIPKFANNAFHIEMAELSRIEVDLLAMSAGNTVIAGYQVVGDRLQRLPVGSKLDIEKGVFYWQPGPGFLKEYQLVFIEKGPAGELSRKNINIKIVPKFK